MFFLLDSDYNASISPTDLTQVIGTDEALKETIEKRAIKEVHSYLGSRYNTTKIFEPFAPYAPTKEYGPGARVTYTASAPGAQKQFFYALKAVPEGIDINNAEYWKEGDNRDEQIIGALVDVVLYHLHSRITPRNIPSIRQKRYDEAKTWLEGVAEGNNVTTLPLLTPSVGQRTTYGSRTKNEHYW